MSQMGHFRQINPLPTLSACPLRSDRVRTFAPQRFDAVCRYCCKSPKLPGANFLAVKKSDRRPPIDVASITLPRSPASLSSGDEVPHIFTRKSRLRPKEFLIASAKRLLQQNLPGPDSCSAAYAVRGCDDVAVGTRVSSRAPRTEPYVRLSRIRLPPRVCDGKAFARPRMKDARGRDCASAAIIMGRPARITCGTTNGMGRSSGQ